MSFTPSKVFLMSNNQKEAFLEFEADEWFQRNKSFIESFDGSKDSVSRAIANYAIPLNKVLEVGCSAGHRLNYLQRHYPQASFSGLEPSQKAIANGQMAYPSVQFYPGTVDDMSMFADNSFDVVIIGFVFYVVDRALLLKSIGEIDRVLKNGGQLIILDFFYPKPFANHYHHIKDQETFAYKQSYEDIFLASRLYHLLAKETFNHSSGVQSVSEAYSELCSLTILKKDLRAVYQ